MEPRAGGAKLEGHSIKSDAELARRGGTQGEASGVGPCLVPSMSAFGAVLLPSMNTSRIWRATNAGILLDRITSIYAYILTLGPSKVARLVSYQGRAIQLY